MANGERSRTAPAPAGRRRRAAWVLGLGVLGGVLFTVGFVVRARCWADECPSGITPDLFDLDSVGGLPRLFTTALFLAVAWLAARIARRTPGPPRSWWWAVCVAGALLAVAKSVSVHSALEREDGQYLTLAVGLVGTLVGLPLLWWQGRRRAVPATDSVTVALALYSVAALVLDRVTALVSWWDPGPVLLAFASYVEEGGEAVTALLLLAAVAQWTPGPPEADRHF